MDFAAPELHHAGIVATVGKGRRSEAVRQACIDTESVYFAAVRRCGCVSCEVRGKFAHHKRMMIWERKR